MLDRFNLIEYTTFLFTSIGFYLAFFQYYKTSRERRNHLLKLLDSQLRCFGPWVSANIENISLELPDSEKLKNISPFFIIFDTGTIPLINSFNLEEMSNVPQDIIGEITQLYYDIKRIETYQSIKKSILGNDIKFLLGIEKKRNDFICKNPHGTLSNFLDTIKNEEENEIIKIYLNFADRIHRGVIGNKNEGARSHYDKINKWLISERKYCLKTDYYFIVISFISTIAFLITNYYFYFPKSELIFFNPLYTFILFLLGLIITFCLSYISRAIIISNNNW